MKSLFIIFFTIVTLIVHAQANEGPLVKSDGEIDFECTQLNKDQTPYNHFYLTMFISETPELDLVDLLDVSSIFKEGNETFFYRVKVTQFPFYAANILPNMQTIPGCGLAPLSVEMEASGAMNVEFKCEQNGDFGKGSLTVDPETNKAKGTFFFPKKQPELIYPIEAGTQVDVSCKQLQLVI